MNKKHIIASLFTCGIISMIGNMLWFTHAQYLTPHTNAINNLISFNQIFSNKNNIQNNIYQQTETFCFDGQDNDSDGLIDCQDRDCYDRWACSPIEYQCDDQRDNDSDGLVDCTDPDCSSHIACSTWRAHGSAPLHREICDDEYDNDNNGFTDCSDIACITSPICGIQTKTELFCDDQRDNDGDGKIDCADPDCQNTPQITYCQSIELSCSDGKDNDGDGKIDCEDANCLWLQGCSTDNKERSCNDRKDNDGDGKIDCEDADCTLQCTIETCHDNVDNDGDGKTDCHDIDCHGKSNKKWICEYEIELSCNDGVDNNQDGEKDCEDLHCAWTESCNTQCWNQIIEYGEQCDDGNKTNNDGCDNLCQLESPSCDIAISIQWATMILSNTHDRFDTKNLSVNQSKRIDLFKKISLPIDKTGDVSIDRTAQNQTAQSTCNRTISIKKIPWCTNASANNYKANATRDDGSCTYSQQKTDCTLLQLQKEHNHNSTTLSRNKQLKKFPNIKKISLLVNKFTVNVTQLDQFIINKKITQAYLQTILKNGDTLLCSFK